MRGIVKAFACAGVLLAAAGCSGSDKHYFKEGIGANLYSESAIPIADDAAARTKLLDDYVANICDQAGLDSRECAVGATNPAAWSLFVQAGMNDIDQRCDAYLTWLDNVRRAYPHNLKEIADAQTATTLIMTAAGEHNTAIAIVAAAFGFATSTYTNVMGRLVLELDKSTVQTIVLSRQKKYREDLFGTATSRPKAIIGSRPAAIFALRSYLRLCMPMTIETQANTTITTLERVGGTAIDQARARGDSMIAAKTVGVTVITPSPMGPSYQRLRSLMFPGGKADPEIFNYVERLLGSPPVRAGRMLNEAQYVHLYDKISNCIVARTAGKPCPEGSLKKFR